MNLNKKVAGREFLGSLITSSSSPDYLPSKIEVGGKKP